MTTSVRELVQIAVTGVVQGVGFRPFVYGLAQRWGITGWVLNHSGGVTIEAEGPPDVLDAFIAALRREAPPLARIDSLEVLVCPVAGHTRFEIRPSQGRPGQHLPVPPDVATCAECLREVLDPADRRFRHPFASCVNCGPRYTIISALPYDRARTSMAPFPLCPACQRECADPTDRRFHAQPNACPACGPRLSLVAGAAQPHLALPPEDGRDALARAAQMLAEGAVLAIKGLGGFHLACDATNPEAVATLRRRKARPHKPLAVMMPDLATVRQHCLVNAAEAQLLAGPEAPIVLLPWQSGSTVTEEVAPGQRFLGVMLPTTPLYHVLARDVGRPLVMTSGNLAEEPLAAENGEALERLAPLADALLLHDRRIQARCDDSVWFVPDVAGEPVPQPIRRARGYAPLPVPLPFEVPPTLACGAEIKNTFCLARGTQAFLSQHIGDLDGLATLEHWERTLAHYRALFGIAPDYVAVDLHPDAVASRLGRDIAARRREVAARGRKVAAQEGLPVVEVQHHHAHLAACLADNGWRPEDGPVIGVCLDGAGYGTDGHIWGGEWLVGDYGGAVRRGRLEYLPLAGGDAATRHPWRTAAGYLQALLGEAPEWLVPAGAPAGALAALRQQVARGVNAPLTSSMGRLFDAVAALMGVRSSVTYEAQAAIELEMLAIGARGEGGAGYPVPLDRTEEGWVARLGPLFRALLGDIARGEDPGAIARRFHLSVVRLTADLCRRIAGETGLDVVALSGGCFQNRLLLGETVTALRGQELRVLLHHQVPANDGGLSLGQAVIAQQMIGRG